MHFAILLAFVVSCFTLSTSFAFEGWYFGAGSVSSSVDTKYNGISTTTSSVSTDKPYQAVDTSLLTDQTFNMHNASQKQQLQSILSSGVIDSNITNLKIKAYPDYSFTSTPSGQTSQQYYGSIFSNTTLYTDFVTYDNYSINNFTFQDIPHDGVGLESVYYFESDITPNYTTNSSTSVSSTSSIQSSRSNNENGQYFTIGYKKYIRGMFFASPQIEFDHYGNSSSQVLEKTPTINRAFNADIKAGYDFTTPVKFLPRISVYGIGGLSKRDGSDFSLGYKYGVGSEMFINKNVSISLTYSEARYKANKKTTLASQNGTNASYTTSDYNIETADGDITFKVLDSYTQASGGSVTTANSRTDVIKSLKVGLNYYIN